MFAEKPSEGVNLVIFSPTVLITLCPSVANPKTIPAAPINNIQAGEVESTAITPPD